MLGKSSQSFGYFYWRKIFKGRFYDSYKVEYIIFSIFLAAQLYN